MTRRSVDPLATHCATLPWHSMRVSQRNETRLAATVDSSASEHAGFLATKTFGSLDGLRAVSILAVVWHHTHDGFSGWPISKRGFLGVDLFFLISGFLIVTLLLREHRRSGTMSLRNFYIRRFLRIFPPYYAMLALVAAIVFIKPGGTSLALRRDLPYALFYVANLVPMSSLLAITWSLAVEEQFYLIVPAVLKYAGKAFPLILAISYLLVILPPFGFFAGTELPSFFRETTFGPILLGVMLALLLDDPMSYRWISRALGHPVIPLFAVALVMVACSQSADDISGWPRMAIHWSLLVLLAACVVREQHVLEPVLRSWPMVRIGAVSYSIYLCHLLVRHGVDKGIRLGGWSSPLILFLGTMLASWVAAEISYWAFESRFLALKRRWT